MNSNAARRGTQRAAALYTARYTARCIAADTTRNSQRYLMDIGEKTMTGQRRLLLIVPNLMP